MNPNYELLNLICYSVGFAYSIFAGLLIGRTQKPLYIGFENLKVRGWEPKVTGLVERGLYTASILAGFPQFIGFWLAVKTISHWDIFKSDSNALAKGDLAPVGNGRSNFNNYFINTGLSLAYGIAGAFIASNLIYCRFLSATTLAIGVIVLHLILNWYIGVKTKDKKTNKKDITQLNLGDE